MKKKTKEKETGPDPYYFDSDAADRAVYFIENHTIHTKGELAGTAFILAEWERKIVRDVFGWKRVSDGYRKYRTVFIFVPRKNGKSTLAAAIALYMTYADGEPGAEVYSAAADRGQAAIVFEIARKIAESDVHLSGRSEIYTKVIFVPSTFSYYRVLSSEAFTKHGLNASGIIFDELHAQPNRDLWDVLTTSVAARREPLTIAITTAGISTETIAYEQYLYAVGVQNGEINDPSFYPVIYEAAESDRWDDPEVWKKANPGFGESLTEEYLIEKARKARYTPALINTFRRLHLNQWAGSVSKFFDMAIWDRGAEPRFDPSLFHGAECYAGLDLASVSDLAAFVLVFPPDADVFDSGLWSAIPYFWIPAENVQDRIDKDRVPYDLYIREGYVKTTPGNVVDYETIIRDIASISELFNIRRIAFDRWGAFQISNRLTAIGLEMIGFGQGFRSLSEPTKELNRLVLDERLKHNGNPVLRWNAANTIISTDAAGNMKPDKGKSREKIDGIVSLIMGIDSAVRERTGDATGPSVYEERGLRSVG